MTQSKLSTCKNANILKSLSPPSTQEASRLITVDHPAVQYLLHKTALLAPMLLVCILPISAVRAQALPAGTSHNAAAAYVTIGGGNSQFPSYADNALGFNFGLYYQHSLFVGAEIRGGSYPINARYSQSPVTAGYRVGTRSEEGQSDLGWSPLSVRHWVPFGYFGGGISYAQDSGYAWQNTPLGANSAPCWEGSIGVDRSYRFVTWRMAEVSYVRTYTPLHNVRTAYASTGLVFHFRH